MLRRSNLFLIRHKSSAATKESAEAAAVATAKATEAFDASTGIFFMRNRFYNKGTAFTAEERDLFSMHGRLPPAIETLEDQVARTTDQFHRLERRINRYQMLRTLQDNNNTLYYATVLKSLPETLPVIYTPTVGEACQQFGSLYMRDHGMYISYKDRGNIRKILQSGLKKEAEIIVITDGSRILGLGDLGTNGMGIPIGKCSLYVAGGGIDPRRCLPIMLDVGTNNVKLRNDEVYLGLREPRQNDKIFYETFDEFMEAVQEIFPKALVQFEDFSNNHCFDILSRYREKHLCFNDDIQGTGTVVSAGLVNAMRLSGVEPRNHRILFFGAGSAAVGVASSIARLMQFRYGITADEFKKQVSFYDLNGLLCTDRKTQPLPFQQWWARTDITQEQHEKISSLQEAFDFVKPTVFIGLSGAGRVFTEDMTKSMMQHSKNPIIFPLSNPTSQAEADPSEVYRWSNGTAIIASGSPFPTTFLNEKPHTPSQGNNFYAFPGIGLGSIMCGATKITDKMLTAASNAIAECTSETQLHSRGLLYPRITKIRDVSAKVAAALIMQAQEDGVATVELPQNIPDLIRIARARMWEPKYETTDFLKTYAKTRLAKKPIAETKSTKKK